MRKAQWVSSGIYLVFIALATVLYHEGLGSDVTAIIEMTRPVAWILPIMIAVAAVAFARGRLEGAAGGAAGGSRWGPPRATLCWQISVLPGLRTRVPR